MYSVNPFYGNYQDEMQIMAIVTAVILILSLIGSIVIYLLFLTKRNEGRFTGFIGFLYDFLSFNKLMIETIIKVLYLFFTLAVTLLGIVSLFRNFLFGLFLIIGGNLLIRLIYEKSIMKILVCKNTSEINIKLNRLIHKNMPENRTNLPKHHTGLQEEANAEVPEDYGTQPSSPVFFSEVSKKTCPHCGKKLKPTAKFCPFCGNQAE